MNPFDNAKEEVRQAIKDDAGKSKSDMNDQSSEDSSDMPSSKDLAEAVGDDDIHLVVGDTTLDDPAEIAAFVMKYKEVFMGSAEIKSKDKQNDETNGEPKEEDNGDY